MKLTIEWDEGTPGDHELDDVHAESNGVCEYRSVQDAIDDAEAIFAGRPVVFASGMIFDENGETVAEQANGGWETFQ